MGIEHLNTCIALIPRFALPKTSSSRGLITCFSSSLAYLICVSVIDYPFLLVRFLTSALDSRCWRLCISFLAWDFSFSFLSIRGANDGSLGDTIPEDAHMIRFPDISLLHLEIGVDPLPCSCKIAFRRHAGGPRLILYRTLGR